jgi:DNA-binding response OmpR family regulator
VRILLVEDEPKLAALIARGLSEESFAVDVAASGEQAVELAARTTYDLVVLDVVLPAMDGFAVIRALRARHDETPILMLSARGLVDDRVKGLETGADDYLTKPFSFTELSARVRALLRRRRPEARVLAVGDLTLDPITRLVKRGERRIELTQKEYALLEYLMRHAGQAVTRAMIAERVWDVHWEPLTNVIDVYIGHLRRKIESGNGPRLIHAVRGVGYVLRSEEAPA